MDRLAPSVTFMLYLGEEEWDGPKSIHDMIDFTGIPEELRCFVQDYKINMIEVRKLPQSVLDQLKTDVKNVFEFIKVSNNRDTLIQMIEQEEYFSHMEDDAYNLVRHYAKELNDIEIKEEGGKVDMRSAISDLIEEGREEGRKEGRKEGREEGIRVTKAIFRLDMEGYEISDIATELQIEEDFVKKVLEEE